MKQGNQFYLAIEITDADDKIIDIENISKIQFTFNDVLKIYDGEKDEVAGYFYFDLDKNLLKAFFCNYGEYEQADEEFLTQFDWDSMLETYYWEPYYGGDNHIIDQYLRKVSEEGLPDFIKNSI